MQNIPVKKRGLRPLDYIIVLVASALICVLVNTFGAALIALPVQLIHKLTYGPQ